jgi:hypothetical protein
MEAAHPPPNISSSHESGAAQGETLLGNLQPAVVRSFGADASDGPVGAQVRAGAAQQVHHPGRTDRVAVDDKIEHIPGIQEGRIERGAAGRPPPAFSARAGFENGYSRPDQPRQHVEASERRRHEPQPDRSPGAHTVEVDLEVPPGKDEAGRDGAHARVLEQGEGGLQPPLARHRMLAEEGEDVATGLRGGAIGCDGESGARRETQEPDACSASDVGGGAPRRSVVDDDDFVCLPEDRVDAAGEDVARLVRDDGDRDAQEAAFSDERSMTLSMKPYSRASSAVNQRSRSESAWMRSMDWPVWKAIRSAIMCFK